MGKSTYSLAGFRKFATKLVDESAKPLRVEAFQARSLREHFLGTPEVVILVPEENGKTTLLGALGLYHLRHGSWTDPYIPLFASSRDQAGYLFDQAAGLVERSGLEGVYDVKRGYRAIRLRSNVRAKIQVKASDERTSDGLIPTLVLVDEYHRHRTDGAYSISRHKLGKRNGRMVTISTGGANLSSPLGRLRTKAHEMPGFIRRGTYNRVVTDNFAWHEWCLDETDDLDDLRRVKRANPASFVTVDYLRAKRESPSHSPSRWARYVCGVWGASDEPWVEAPVWDALAGQVGGVAAGDDVVIAVRAGAEAGIGICSPRPQGRMAVRAEKVHFPGSRVPLEAVERRLQTLSKIYDVREIAYDREQFQRSAELLAEQGLPMIEVPQRPQRVAQASVTLWRAISGGMLGHDGDPVLREQVLATATKETVSGWRLEPTERNPSVIALAFAVHQATEAPTETPTFQVL